MKAPYAKPQSKLGLEDLEIILALHRGRNLAGAAERLKVDASTVFRSIKRIEKDIGEMLFDRGRHGYVATELGREIGNGEAFAGIRKREVLPGPSVKSKADMEAFLRKACSTFFHPVGTCRMGTGSDAVVDPELRVHGVEGLRVADASIMPSITTGNTNAPSILIGWKAAEMLSA